MKKKSLNKFISLILLLGFLLTYIYNSDFTFNEDSEKDIKLKEIEEVVNVSGNLKVYFLDVGQADSILITNNGEYMLIDAGNNEDGEKLVTYFNALGIKNFNYVIGTHAHEDHIGGMDDVINNFNIDNFYMPDVITSTKTFEDVLDALDEKQLAFQTPEIDATFSFAECKFEVLYVGEDNDDLNDSSIVLKMYYGNQSFLFMADATSKVEKAILNKELKSDVLKVGHHGSQYSSTSDFLEKVSPKYAVIQVGINNSYHHPKDATLNRLENLGSKIYRTDIDGTIVASSDGTNITFETISTDTNG